MRWGKGEVWQKQVTPKKSNKCTIISSSPGMKKQHFASNGPYGLMTCMPKSVEISSKFCTQAASMAACGGKVVFPLWNSKKNCRFCEGRHGLRKCVSIHESHVDQSFGGEIKHAQKHKDLLYLIHFWIWLTPSVEGHHLL